MEETTLRSLIDTVITGSDAGNRYCFILGAGASRESGIKTGAEMAKQWLEELEEIEKKGTQEWIEKENIDKKDLGFHYSKIYERRFRLNPANGFIILQNEIEKAIPSPGYYYLAEIINETQNKLVITTNFDSLTEDSLFTYKKRKALVITHESLAKYIDALANRPTVIKLHRDILLQPKSDEADVNTLSEEWKNSLQKIMEIYVPIVIGYGGNDGSLMGFLEGVASKDKIIYWCYKRGNPVNDRIKNLLEKYRGFLISIENFDDTMHLFGTYFKCNFSEETIRRITNDRAEELINKYNEWKENRRKTLDGQKTLSDTESMTIDSFLFLSEKSILELEKKIANGQQNAGDYYRLGFEYYLKEKYDKAIEYYTEAIKLKPDNAQYYISRGISYNWLNEYEKSTADYSKAIELEPDNAKYYFNRGTNYIWLNEFEKSIADYSKAIELEPDNAEYYLDFAHILCRAGDFDNALANINTAMSLDRVLDRCYNVRGFIGLKKAKHEKTKCASDVLNDLSKAIELNIELNINDDYYTSQFYTDRAEYYLYSNEPEKAYDDLKEALNNNDKYGRAYFFMASYYKIKGNNQEYERCMTKVNECRYIPDDNDY